MALMDFVAFMCALSLTITFAGLDVGLLKKDAWKANWCRVRQIRCYRLFPETLSCVPKPSPDVDNFTASRAADSAIDGCRTD